MEHKFILQEEWKAKAPGVLAVYYNGEYIVEVWPCVEESGMDVRLAIKRVDKQPIRTWRHLQTIKNEIVGGNITAVEVYPHEDEVTDTANIYHLWVFPEGYSPNFTLIPKQE